MDEVGHVDALRRRLAGWREAGERIALVPTMGNLHAGHLSLVDKAGALADRVVVSLFVNPAQFGPGEDFNAYPRTLDADRGALRPRSCDLLFLPREADLYPHGLESAVRVSVPGVSETLEGAHRPGHFDGVATVVLRLLIAAAPHVAVFGRKDYQQLQVIRRLAADLHVDTAIEAGPIVRDADGLALSSRNRYLSGSERRRAPVLYRSLQACAAALEAGDRAFEALESRGLADLRRAGFEPDYLAIRRPDLSPPAADGDTFVVLGAARLGQTRLIDNIVVAQA